MPGMGVDAVLTHEDASRFTELPDPAMGGTFDAAGDFDRLIPAHDDASFACWRFIDFYGRTVFNRRQMPVFIEELDRLLPSAKNGPERNGMLRLRMLASIGVAKPHRYLVLRGD